MNEVIIDERSDKLEVIANPFLQVIKKKNMNDNQYHKVQREIKIHK